MTRHLVVGLAFVVACAGVVRGQEQAFVGRFELSGRYNPTLRRTTVTLDVTTDGQALRVTRTAVVGGQTITWTGTRAQVTGTRLTVRYEVGGGLVGGLPGSPPNLFVGSYYLSGAGQRLSESVRNTTRRAPEDRWTSISTRGGRAAGLSPALGATALADMAAFERFARRDDVPGAQNVREVKFLMVGVDGPDPTLYLINTKDVSYHYDFYTRGLGHSTSLEEFNRQTYFTDARSNLAGTIVYHDAYVSPAGERGLFALEFWPTDAVKAPLVGAAFHALVRAMPFAASRIAYHPAGETQEALYAQERARLEQLRVRVVSTNDLFGALTYAALNPGEGYGTLRVIDPLTPGRPASVRDVVIFKRLPNDLSHTGGIITEQPQTPLSHVNLKAKQNKTPNAFVKDASTHPRVAPLLGKLVYFRAGPDDFELREATTQEAEAFLERLRPANPSFPPRDLSVTRVRPLSELNHGDADSVGAKAANVAELRRLLGPNVVPDGFGIPFWCYDEFMKHNGLYARAQAFMVDPAFRADAATRERVLNDFRRDLRRAPVPPAVTAQLNALQAQFPAGVPIRLRSSTNNEDLPGFNGAGLYDSYTHRPDEGNIERTVKQVWSSLWNYRAFEERDFYKIDHLTAAMGVLAHRNFDDEQSNGVAITKNPFDANWPGFYVNAQVGESLITNPDASRPDEFLVSRIGPQGEYEVQYVQRSDQVPAGGTVLTRAQIDALVRVLDRIQTYFKRVYEAQADPTFAMDVEWKFDSQGRLVVKQARPVVD